MLVAREDINPRVVELVLKVAQAVHGPGSLIDPPLLRLHVSLILNEAVARLDRMEGKANR